MSNSKPNIYKLCQDFGELKGTVIEMNKKLDVICINHEGRINAMEDNLSNIKGRATGAGAVAGFIAGAISVVITIIAFFRKQI